MPHAEEIRLAKSIIGHILFNTFQYFLMRRTLLDGEEILYSQRPYESRTMAYNNAWLIIAM